MSASVPTQQPETPPGTPPENPPPPDGPQEVPPGNPPESPPPPAGPPEIPPGNPPEAPPGTPAPEIPDQPPSATGVVSAGPLRIEIQLRFEVDARVHLQRRHRGARHGHEFALRLDRHGFPGAHTP